MNEFEEISDEILDRLVDGELSNDHRRDVLSLLDTEPNGWRRLALAYVEAGEWKRELKRVTAAPSLLVEAQKDSPKTVHRDIASLASIAAILFVGVMAYSAGRWTQTSNQTANQVVVPNRPSQTYKSGIGDVAEDEAGALSEPGFEFPSNAISHQTCRIEFEDHPGGTQRTVEVPVIEQQGIDAQTLWNAQPVISESERRALLLSGQRVTEHRQLYKVQLPDGRNGFVPISNLFIESGTGDAVQ